MEILNDKSEIVLLFIKKLELLNERERDVLIQSIHLMNNPMFIAK